MPSTRCVRVTFVGDPGVGKTAIISQQVFGTFVQHYDPTIEDRYRFECSLNGALHLLDITDTSGDPELATLRNQWFEGSDVFVLVCSASDEESFTNLTAHRDAILAARNAQSAPMILVCNAFDGSGYTATISRERLADLSASFLPSTRVPSHYITATSRSGVLAVFQAAVLSLSSVGSSVRTVAPSRSGWLSKPGGGLLKGDTKRWFCLDGDTGKLTYFKDEADATNLSAALGVLDLTNARVAVEGKLLRLTGPLNPKKVGKDYVLTAPSADDAHAWADSITTAAIVRRAIRGS